MTVDKLLLWVRYLLPGLKLTLQTTALITPLFIIVGILISIMRLSNNRIFRSIGYIYVEIFRGTPLIGQLFMGFYVLPFIHITLPDMLVGVTVVALNMGAYTSEIFRSGIESVDVGQWEAGRILNLSNFFILSRVILPQALRISLPAIGNAIVEVFRITSALGLLGIFELTMRGWTLMQISARPLPVWTLVFIFYFIVSYPASLFVKYLEGKLTVERE